jgi:hypothetical protein
VQPLDNTQIQNLSLFFLARSRMEILEGGVKDKGQDSIKKLVQCVSKFHT